MNGLLHRLAARAVGTAVLVRADARLPYGGRALDWADEAEGQAAPALADPPRSDSASAHGPHDLPPSVAPARSRELTWPVVEPPGWEEPTPPLSLDVASAVDHVAAEGTRPPMRARVAATPAPPAQGAGRPAATASPAVSGPLATPATITTPAGQEAEVVPPWPPVPVRTDDPTPLMPRVTARPAPAPTPMASQPRDAGPNAAAEAPGDDNTEVHIHIGRIEVTAVHDAPPAPRRRAPGPAPMSLDGYLATRRRSDA